MKRIKYFLFCIFSFVLLSHSACTTDDETRVQSMTVPDTSDSTGSSEKNYLEDRTGKRWDITHAVQEYGMDPENFRYGLGPDAIRPINNPDFLVAGQQGFPVASGTFSVIGVNFHGEPRAYPIGVLRNHEVINDRVGSTHFSAVY